VVGTIISHYEVLEKIGQGGMGEVFLAQDTSLDRKVALKFLSEELKRDPAARKRLLREAKSAAALDHPFICQIHEVGEVTGKSFIAMEYIQGTTLEEKLVEGPLPVRKALETAREMAEALEAAHKQKMVHRDLKPSNIMLTSEGHVKVMDFGLAKRVIPPEGREKEITTVLTREGATLGTVPYMSPEQVRGQEVDTRSDIFSFGVVLYEMLSGRHPFLKPDRMETAGAILRDAPPPLDDPELERVVRRCLEKDRESRYPSFGELGNDLKAYHSRLVAPGLGQMLRRPRYAIPALVILAALISISFWVWVRSSRVYWARNVALPEIARLLDKGDYYAAFQLTRQAKRHLPEDPQLEAHLRSLAVPVSIHTTPPGADVYMSDYLAADDPVTWEWLGRSPLEQALVPGTHLRWRVTKEGFEDVERATALAGLFSDRVTFTLHPLNTGPPGMVFAPGGRRRLRRAGPAVQLDDYWIDKYEVSNRQFQEFVSAGGYERSELWKHPFVKDGQILSWEEAMAEFRDTTGRPGPSTWELGSYPEGQADFPVSGAGWHEAVAYCEFVGKSLPTVHHWDGAAGASMLVEVLAQRSNLSSKGPDRVGSHQGVGPYGTYDMTGNIREWCWNEDGGIPWAHRYILGASWGDPVYMAWELVRMLPFDRSPSNGFRCAKYPVPLSEEVLAPVANPVRDYSKEKPTSDEVFQVYKSIYSYDRTDLEAVVESVDDSSEQWQKEKITFNAAYGGERVIAYLFLPKVVAPPYQVVVYFPGAASLRLRSISWLDMPFTDFIVRSGRALLYPVYQDTYERRVQAAQRGPNFDRDLGIQWFKDLARSIDYMETRPDIDHEKLAYYGFSLGANWAPIFMALEERIKGGVLLGGGFYPYWPPPESEPFHFAPRVRQPVLMVNGEHDYAYPLETSQRPLFRLLGTPEKDKRHVVFEDAGHVVPRQAFIKEILDWLDRYLGPVKMR
jgi:dienelactone hydrolase/predicted Ser/Thr protein kinase